MFHTKRVFFSLELQFAVYSLRYSVHTVHRIEIRIQLVFHYFIISFLLFVQYLPLTSIRVGRGK